MEHWIVTFGGGVWWLELIGKDDIQIKTHPIPFDNARDAARACARLNARDDLIG